MEKSNFRKFMLLWAGQLVSAIGGGFTSFGLGVYVFQKTGSAAGMALVTLLGFLPTLLLSVPAGVLADRYDRRLLMMLGDGLSAAGVLYILICMMNDGASILQIGIGVTVTAVFSSLLDPAYKATVTDLLTADEYSKASGLVSLAGSARYLVSPIIAGIMLTVGDIKLLLIIDICTFILTVISTFAVKRGIRTETSAEKLSFKESLREGWNAIRERRGVFLLVLVASLLTLFIGVFQILAEPMILSISDARTLGIAETVCASGMLLSGLYLGARGIRSGYARILSISLALAGVFIIGFGMFESVLFFTLSGFGFFMMLPFANNCLDYLVRTNTPVRLQGRVWGIVGFMSQIGYVISYGCSGIAADLIAKCAGISVGKGAGIVISFAGAALVIVSAGILFIKDIKLLEKNKDGGKEI